MKNHDESKCIKSLKRVAIINGKSIQATHSANIGIKRWGEIDYLCHYCGYTFIYNNAANIIDKQSYETPDKKNEIKEIKRQTKRNIKRNNKNND